MRIYSSFAILFFAFLPIHAEQRHTEWDHIYQSLLSPEITAANKRLLATKLLHLSRTLDEKKASLALLQSSGTFVAMMELAICLDFPEKELQLQAAKAIIDIALSKPDYTGEHLNSLLRRCAQILDEQGVLYPKNHLAALLSKCSDCDRVGEKQGFYPLFNGRDLSGWKGLVGNPHTRRQMDQTRMDKEQAAADARMRKSWVVEGDKLVFTGHGDNICTTRDYGDMELFIDWRLDPQGKEPDAGIYLRGVPQVQIWDVSRVDVGAQVGSGGLYNNQKHSSTPTSCLDHQLGEWNHFHIIMKADKVTVIFNGERVVDAVPLENYWDRSKPLFPREQIELQAHGSRVEYRHIYLREY